MLSGREKKFPLFRRLEVEQTEEILVIPPTSPRKRMIYLGEKEKAVMHGEKAVDLLPVKKDFMRGVFRIEELALIYVMVGKHDKAIDKLKYLLSIPGQLSVQYLKIDPDWVPLHNYPRFQKLIESDK